ncbi:MAG TPA: HAMP domain-containing sensor histidine kinase [Polyangiales bacterium]|nr:HAMP domain-containing sensor histidine kinase [Polyangiales bacterium]
MKLRLRIAAVTLAATAPMVGGLIWLDVRAQQIAAEDELAELVLDRIDLPGERERCELDPDSWNAPPARRGPPHPGPRTGEGPGGPPLQRFPRGVHRLPARLFVYDAALAPRTSGAPTLPADAASERREVISRSSLFESDRVEVLVRTPWPNGRCAFVLARGTTEPWLGALLPPTRIWALPALIVFATVLLSIGPVVRRLRKLTWAVQRTAATHYEQPLALDDATEDEIGELTRAFDRAGQDVRNLLEEKDRRDRALREFLADTTHDLAIPLTVLQGHLSSLRDVHASQALDSAIDEAHYIGALLHNLGAAAKLEAHELALQRAPVELGALVMRVLSRHRPLARQHDVSIDAGIPEQPLSTLADVTLLEQAVSNVVYNAVRHNRKGGHVAILLHELRDRRFRIQVIDDGPGVPETQLAQLTQRGFRDERARTRNPEGRGLGLDITRRVVDAHAMQLTLSTSEAGGLQVDIEGEVAES